MVLSHASTMHTLESHTVPGETGVVRGEALCDALAPDPRRMVLGVFPMFLLCVSWMSMIVLHSYCPVSAHIYEGFYVRFVLVAYDRFISLRICMWKLLVVLLFVDFTHNAAGRLHYNFIL